ncbi:MAG: glutaredoxin family protein [Gammaproteobacteria bacterium]
MADTTLYLYTTSACHLCEQAEAVLASMQWPARLVVEVVDVSETEELLQRYGQRIPVLAVPQANGSLQELDWPFDAYAVQGLLPCEQ